MKFEYLKPDLEEIDLVLEGSFLDTKISGNNVGVDQGGENDEDDDWA